MKITKSQLKEIIKEEIKKFNEESTLGKLEIKEGFGGQLKGKDLEEFEKQRKENAEVLGYTVTGVSDIKEITLDEGYRYKYYRMDMSSKEENFLDGVQYELEKLYPGKEKQIDNFIISLLDVQSDEEWLDKYSGISAKRILQYVKRKGLKPLRKPIK